MKTLTAKDAKYGFGCLMTWRGPVIAKHGRPVDPRAGSDSLYIVRHPDHSAIAADLAPGAQTFSGSRSAFRAH